MADCTAAIEALAAETADGGPGLVLGGPWRNGEKLHNALFVADGGRILARRAKHELPNYGVFDDKRVFDPGPAPGPVVFRGVRLGLMICEDWWYPAVCETPRRDGAEILLSINGSPFEVDKPTRRVDLAVARVVETGLPFVFLNQVGGQDEPGVRGRFLRSQRRSFACLSLPLFAEEVRITDWRRGRRWHLAHSTPAHPTGHAARGANVAGDDARP